jgi:hypothetical protein
MKAILLAFAILVSVSASSQVFFSCHKLKSATKVGNKWNLGEEISTNLTFVMTPRKITVNDRANSVYRIYSDPEDSNEDGYTVTKWMALDENEKRVSIEAVTYNTGQFVLFVRYLDTMYVYYLNLIETTP